MESEPFPESLNRLKGIAMNREEDWDKSPGVAASSAIIIIKRVETTALNSMATLKMH